MSEQDKIEVKKFLSANLHFVIVPPTGGSKKHTVQLEVLPNKNVESGLIERDLIHGGTQWVVSQRFKHLTPSEVSDITGEWFKHKLSYTLNSSGLTNEDFMRVR